MSRYVVWRNIIDGWLYGSFGRHWTNGWNGGVMSRAPIVRLLTYSIPSLAPRQDYNLNWGKHVPPRTRWTEHYDVQGIETALPVVLIRDPMYWMQR
jgi:hypothetical protein